MPNNVNRYRFDVRLGPSITMTVYAFLVDGLLIDTGPYNAQKKAMEYFANHAIDQIFITHHHEDHCGNLRALLDKYNCPVYGHPLCATIIKTPPKLNFLERKVWGGFEAVHSMQAAPDIIESTHYRFETIHTTGHADDHFCLYEASEGWLFTGDMYVHHYIRYFMATESIDQQIQSLRKLLRYNFDYFYCSHSHREKNKRSLLAQKLQFFEDFYGKVAQMNAKGMSESAIMCAMQMKERWMMRILSGGDLSVVNMIRSVIRDEGARQKD